MSNLKISIQDQEQIIKYITELYADYKDDNVKYFLREIKYNICVLFFEMYKTLFIEFGLKQYNSNLMYMNL